MKLLKKITAFMLFLILTVCGCIFYAFKIEPYRLNVMEYTLNENLPGTAGLKIVQFSDLHIKEDFTYENMSKIVLQINKQSPDFVLFTGDLYDNYAKYHDDEHIIAELKKIQANYGKIAVWGNRDYGGGAAKKYKSIMEKAGFTLLRNENLCVTLKSGKDILFTGLDDSMLGNPDLPFSSMPSGCDYKVLLTHEPDTVDNFLDCVYDIVLSGHSHGGQVNLPLFPVINKWAVRSTDLSTTYNAGMYDLKQGSRLYVNTGIGTTHISARFGVVPNIAVFHIYF